jgi:hypothetical protein
MSPSDAPESDPPEPYCATASFSSAISSALIDSADDGLGLLVELVTRASTFSPTEKRSGRCSSRSRDRSERRMKEVRSS